ncbi:MAG: matrixin family metalloprotease [Gammaproteobacteria bacterium]|nr:matrixin family metalloprotease [Gammaproteobacteria bacterium]
MRRPLNPRPVRSPVRLAGAAALLFAWTLLAAASAHAYVLSPYAPGKWGPLAAGTPASVTWSLMPSGPFFAESLAETANTGGTLIWGNITALGDSPAFPAGFEAELQAAFDAWSQVSGITFVRVSEQGVVDYGARPGPGERIGDIRIGAHAFDGAGAVVAFSARPPWFADDTRAGDIQFDLAENWQLHRNPNGPGLSLFLVAAHEIGHALGLEHVNDHGALMFGHYSGYAAGVTGPMADDIAGARYLYGPVLTPLPPALALFACACAALVSLRRRDRGHDPA